MSSGGEMASEDNATSESENILNDGESGGTLRRRKIVKCAKEKIEQGIFCKYLIDQLWEHILYFQLRS